MLTPKLAQEIIDSALRWGEEQEKLEKLNQPQQTSENPPNTQHPLTKVKTSETYEKEVI